LAYDIGSQVDFKNRIAWTLHDGSKKADKDELKESVSLFRISKTLAPADLQLVQRSIQKLRTLKHPYVLKFVESAEMDDSLALVTEPCVPLETWLQRQIEENKTQAGGEAGAGAQDAELRLQELLWGFKCILLALSFLHTNCSLLHGNMGLHAIFVTPNGDWKLAALELACNVSAQEDLDHFLRHQHLLEPFFCPTERQRLGNASEASELLRSKLPPSFLDIYAFGQCFQRVFTMLDLDTPRAFGKYVSSMVHSDYKKRPSASKLCQCAMFNSEHLQFIESLGELSLKQPKEFLEVVSKLEPKLAGLSRAVCAHKILPNLSRALQIAINDFSVRDAREGCRQSVQVSVSLLCRLAAMGKLEEGVFRQTCVPCIVQLWSLTDRTVRTCMLGSLKPLGALIPDSVVNKSIFDHVLAGFSDSNAKLRESTLMSLIYVVDKLEGPQLQDRLVRAIVALQNDAEASIRTNATIFLGKIAVKLSEAVRQRVLCGAFQKAMKDNFVHCRLAGLKTSIACVKMMDAAALATKILPQACILALDKSAEVRAQALLLADACLDLLRANSEAMRLKAEAEAVSKPTSVRGVVSSGGEGTPVGQKNYAELTPSKAAESDGWSSWSVLQGISKSIESATILKEGEVSTPPPSLSRGSLASMDPPQDPLDPLEDPMDGLDLDDDDQDDFDDGGVGMKASDMGGGEGWGDDDLDNLSLEDEPAPPKPARPSGGLVIGGLSSRKSVPVSPPPAAAAAAEVGKKAPKPKVAVKRLALSKTEDNWDDF